MFSKAWFTHHYGWTAPANGVYIGELGCLPWNSPCHSLLATYMLIHDHIMNPTVCSYTTWDSLVYGWQLLLRDTQCVGFMQGWIAFMLTAIISNILLCMVSSEVLFDCTVFGPLKRLYSHYIHVGNLLSALHRPMSNIYTIFLPPVLHINRLRPFCPTTL